MNSKYIFFIFLIFISTFARAQIITTHDFENFFDKQDSLLRLAYHKKDYQTHNAILEKTLKEYHKLPDSVKEHTQYVLHWTYYDLACGNSLLGKKQAALKCFRQAVDAGYADYAHICEDSDLNNIRNEKEFREISESTRKVGDYMYILKRAGRYNAADHRPLPVFTYQSKDDPNLAALRKAFNLDSIAGKGSDMFKIINLMHWVHYLIPHDGNHGNPVIMNAMSLIGECHKDHRGLNCRGLATVLNECYLSLGIRSRIVTCLPKDSLKTDQDCHVINMVYSDSLKKWLWMDPTNNAYLMNENGELLSIEEAREKIIDNKPLILNADANWNRLSTDKNFYLYRYMAKNLYILECPVISQYNMETKIPGKTIEYIQLDPLDYFEQKPDKEQGTHDKTTFITYKTNNKNAFWK